MSYLAMNNTELGLFDPDSMDTAGTELNQRYNAAYPFPHICIDELFPAEVLDMCLQEFPERSGKGWRDVRPRSGALQIKLQSRSAAESSAELLLLPQFPSIY